MELPIFFLIFLLPFSSCTIPLEWQQAKSPLYKNIHSQPHRESRITSGRTAKLGQFPYQALLYISPDASIKTYLCGGSIISTKFIVTAAHCLHEMTNGTVHAGLVDRIMGRPAWSASLNGSQFLVHEGYNPTTIHNDIALINAENIIFSQYVQAVPIPTGRDVSVILVNKLAEVSGWGLTSDYGESAQDLQYIQGPIQKNSICARYFYGDLVTNDHVCLDTKTGRSACNG